MSHRLLPPGAGRCAARLGRAVLAALALAAASYPSPASAASPGAEELRFGTYIFNEPFNEVELRRLRAGGGEVVRTTFQWARVQPTPLPLYNWSEYDALVAKAARAGVSVLPVLIGSPRFAAPQGAHPPTAPLTRFLFARFASAAVERYGHGGSFWTDHPGIPYTPIEAWEVWNEPNLRSFWTAGMPSAPEYGELLKLISRAIKLADPRADVVLAGMPEPKAARAIKMSTFLADLYEVPGVRDSFDVAAMHPYAATVRGVERKLTRIRRVMRRHGDGDKPLWITELGWSSAGIQHFLVKDPATQARLTREAVRMLRRRSDDLGLGTVIWFRWQDPDRPCPRPGGCWYDRAGLFTTDERPKPAWRAFARSTGGSPRAGPLPPDFFDDLTLPFGEL